MRFSERGGWLVQHPDSPLGDLIRSEGALPQGAALEPPRIEPDAPPPGDLRPYARPLARFIGVDLGCVQDHTAMAVIERVDVKGDFDHVHFCHRWIEELRVVHLERLPLGTPYTDIVQEIRHLVQVLPPNAPCELVADATGVGLPVIDMLRAAGLACPLKPVVITGGLKANSKDGVWRIPRRELLTRLQVGFEQGRIKIAAGLPCVETLTRELLSMRATPSMHSSDELLWRESDHDDLAFAVALAVWSTNWPSIGFGAERLF